MRRYEEVEIFRLKPYERNARTHDASQVEKIANSIKEFGFINPVLVDKDLTIIAGHGRVMGAKKLGMTKVPCLFVEDLSEEQKRAYIIADNKLALDAGWDIVLDLFGGSGTTIMACEQNGRRGFLMEYDPKYVDAIIDRWEQFTGEKAELLNGGENG